MNTTYECLNCKQCSQLLTRYEALKREQAKIQSRLAECAAEASEIVAQVAESRRAYTQHSAMHRGAQLSSSNIAGHGCSCAAV